MPFPVLDETMNRTPSLNPIDARGMPIGRGGRPFPIFEEIRRGTPSLNPIDARGMPIGGESFRGTPSLNPIDARGMPIDDRGGRLPVPMPIRDREAKPINIAPQLNIAPQKERAADPDPFEGKDDFYAFKNTLRDSGDMGRYVAPGEEMSYEDFVKFGRPANLAAAEAAGYGGAGSGVVGGNLGPIDPDARPRPGMLPQPIEINPNYRPNLPYRPNPNLPFNGNPNMYQRPMPRPFGFGGRPMNPFMGMGIGMMNPMGMGMFGGFPMRPPMFGGYGGYGGGYGGYGGGYNMMRPPMGFGLGGANPYGMNPYSNFGRPNPYPQPSYNMPSPYSSGMNFNQPNFMQQQQGGYGSYQQPSGYGNYGGMQNPYQPQQFGYNPNNSMGYGQRQAQLMGPSIQGPNGMSSQDLVPM